MSASPMLEAFGALNHSLLTSITLLKNTFHFAPMQYQVAFLMS